MQERTKQGGSVLVFSIIGVVLVAAVIGLVFLVNKRADDSLAGPLFEMPGESESSDQSESSGSSESGDQSESDKQTDESSASESDQSSESSTETESTPSDEPSDRSSTSADDKSGAAAEEGQEPLPATGPTENVLAGLMLAIMAAAIIAYARSRVRLGDVSLTNRD